MSTSTLELIETTDSGSSEELMHLYCETCYPFDPDATHALCGHEFNEMWASEYTTDNNCVVCEDLFDYHWKMEHE